MAYGNLALDLAAHQIHGRLVVLRNGRYDNMPIEVIVATKKSSTYQRAIQHRTAAAALSELRDEAAVHHDQRIGKDGRAQIKVQP
jgi:hypothetical protein